MDADLPECRRARVDEPVRRLGGDDDDISCGRLYRLLLDSEADCVATRGLQSRKYDQKPRSRTQSCLSLGGLEIGLGLIRRFGATLTATALGQLFLYGRY